MVNFFIGRPIFATVLALLMLLDRRHLHLPAADRAVSRRSPRPRSRSRRPTPGPTPQTVADTVTTPIEQQINGTKGHDLLQLRQHQQRRVEHRRHVRRRLLQDIAAVDIQNKVQTAQASLPPEVKQYGVTIKKTSTDMVCVVNLISPDGRYDATFLDNYGQIYVADVLKRIPGVSDVNVFGRKYAMRIWLDPDRMANHADRADRGRSRRSSRRTCRPPPARSAAVPVPPGQDFEYPITVKGRLEKVEEFEEIIVRRNDDGSIVRLKDVARVELDSENYETAG